MHNLIPVSIQAIVQELARVVLQGVLMLVHGAFFGDVNHVLSWDKLLDLVLLEWDFMVCFFRRKANYLRGHTIN